MSDRVSNSSGSKTADAAITTQPSILCGIDMITPTTGTATLVIYDSANSSVSGKLILAEMEVDAGMPSCNHEYMAAVVAQNGLYAVLTDASVSASYIIRFALA